MELFKDYVGLIRRGRGAYEASPSGLYVNTLPGITLESFEDLADGEQRGWYTVWNDVQAEAEARFYLDIVNETRKCHEFNRKCDYEQLIEDNMALLANSWKFLLGVQLMTERLYSTSINRWTTVDREQARELRDSFQQEYAIALEQAVKAFDTEECDDELECGGNPQTVTWLP
jgi:hypothetical protein